MVAKKAPVKKRTPAKKKNVTIGFVGTTKITAKLLASTLDDVLAENAKANVTFVVPSSKGFMNEYLGAVVDYAGGKGIPVEAVHTEADLKSRTANIKGIISEASATHLVKNVPLKLVNILAKAIDSGDEAKLFVLLDEDANSEKILDKAVEKEIPMFDLTNGLAELEADDEDDAEDSDDEDDSDDEAEDGDDSDDDDADDDPDDSDDEDDAEDGDEDDPDDEDDSDDPDDDEDEKPKKSAKSKKSDVDGEAENLAKAVLAALVELLTAARDAE